MLPRARHRRACWALILATACAAPLAPPAPAPCAVRVHNPEGLALELVAAVRDGFVAVPGGDLGDAGRRELRLLPGRYALRLPGGELLPVPVLPDAPALEVPVESWPEPREGFAWIPPGPALRGDDLGVGQEDERPASTPHVDGFWLATHETTNAQFVAFLQALPRAVVDEAWLDLDGAKCRVQWDDAAQRFETDAPALPVVTVSWAGAVAYCEWRTRTTGVRHRLPTETEWEKAARGPGSRVYAYGDTCRTDAANQESGRLREVGSYEPNGFGLYDMTANAFEWCADAYARRAYDREVAADTPDAFRVLRGGSFVLDGIFCRNAMRMRLRPDVRADDVGFRVLREQRPAR